MTNDVTKFNGTNTVTYTLTETPLTAEDVQKKIALNSFWADDKQRAEIAIKVAADVAANPTRKEVKTMSYTRCCSGANPSGQVTIGRDGNVRRMFSRGAYCRHCGAAFVNEEVTLDKAA